MKLVLALNAILALSVLRLAGQTLASALPSIGFDLTLNYGTVAVAYSNGTVIPVAKIEGGLEYKAEMRKLLHEAMVPDTEPTGLENIRLMITSYLQVFNLVEKPVRPSPLRPMLQALKTSAKAFLEDEVQTVEVSVPLSRPYSTREDKQTQNLDKLLETIGLWRTNERPTRASVAACKANNISALSENDLASKSILVIDCSRSGLLLSLENLEVGVLEKTNMTALLDLGADSRHTFSDHWRSVERELRNMVKGVLLQDVVLSGDRVLADERLLETLKRVLGKKAIQGKKLMPAGVDPAFLSAIGVAMIGTETRYDEDNSERGL